MAFGKRVSPSASKETTTGPAAVATTYVAKTSSLFIERATRLKEHIERILLSAQAIALAIKAGECIDEQGFVPDLEPDIFPIDIAGFAHHFNFQRDGKLKHGVYAYSRADGVLDRAAQLHLLDLTSAIMRLNTMCALAHKDGALIVALQSDAARNDVDRVIVLAGFLGGMLSNLITVQYAKHTDGKQPSPEVLHRQLDEWGKATYQSMLDPQKFELVAPKFDWPLMLVEAEEDDHDGQIVINQVYLPADIAGPMRHMLAREQVNAATGRFAA